MRRYGQLLLRWLVVATIVWNIIQLYLVDKHIQQLHDQQVEALKAIRQQINVIDEHLHQCTDALIEKTDKE